MTDQKPKVLLLEDDPFMSALLNEGFAKEGWEVVLALNGQEALRQFRQNKPDILLIHIILPGKSVLQVLGEIRALPEGTDTPALILSNIEEANYLHEAEKLGVKGYLIKANMQIEEIVAKVKEALKR